jgi:hypothetical protein
VDGLLPLGSPLTNAKNPCYTPGEHLYQTAVTAVINHCLTRHPSLEIYLDRRYTNRQQAEGLTNTIQTNIHRANQQTISPTIVQADSASHPGIQAADFVAWAFRQKYESQKDWAHDLLQNRIVQEQLLVIKQKKAALPVSR